MIVYIVLKIEDEIYCHGKEIIVASFSTEEYATQYVNEHSKTYPLIELRIQGLELDTQIHEKSMKCFECHISKETGKIVKEQEYYQMHHFHDSATLKSGNTYISKSFKSKQHARDLAFKFLGDHK